MDEEEAAKYSFGIAGFVTLLYTLITSQISWWTAIVFICSVVAPYVLLQFDELENPLKIGGLVAVIGLLFILVNPMGFMVAHPYAIASTENTALDMSLKEFEIKTNMQTPVTGDKISLSGTSKSFDPDHESKGLPDLSFSIKAGSGKLVEKTSEYAIGSTKYQAYLLEFNVKVTAETWGTSTIGDPADETATGYYVNSKLKVSTKITNHNNRWVMVEKTSSVKGDNDGQCACNGGSFSGSKVDWSTISEESPSNQGKYEFTMTLTLAKARVPDQGFGAKGESQHYSGYWNIVLSVVLVRKAGTVSQPSDGDGNGNGYTPPPEEPPYEEPPPPGYEPPIEGDIPGTPGFDTKWILAIVGVIGFFFLMLLLGGGALLLILMLRRRD